MDTIKNEVFVNVIEKNNKPCIVIQKYLTNKDDIEAIVRAASHEQPIIILPRFGSKVKALNALIEKGILYRDDNGNLYFTF